MGLSHIALHVTLCRSAATLSQKTPLALRVVLAYARRDPAMDRVFPIHRESDGTAVVEFDASQGVYRLTADLQKPRCGAMQFVAVLPDHDRDVSVKLEQGARPAAMVPAISPAIVAGDSPAYEQPTVVLFTGTLACNAPVGRFASDPIVSESGAQGYYASIFSLAGIADPKSRTAALRLTDSSGGYHYIRLPMYYPSSPQAFASFERLNVTDDVLQYAAGKPEDTLLCPPLLRTSAG
jgi:hypothetical protein